MKIIKEKLLKPSYEVVWTRDFFTDGNKKIREWNENQGILGARIEGENKEGTKILEGKETAMRRKRREKERNHEGT